MQQKKIWMHFLIIGISLAFSSCQGETEFINTVEFLFHNQSDQKILFTQYPESEFGLELLPNKSTDVLTVKGGGPRNPDPLLCCQDMLDNLIGPSGKYYVLDDTLCILHKNEKSDLIENYDIKVFSERHFRYSYTFRSTDFVDTQTCE